LLQSYTEFFPAALEDISEIEAGGFTRIGLLLLQTKRKSEMGFYCTADCIWKLKRNFG
jgi:hypothetical protein